MDAIGCGSSWALATHTVFQSCASAAHRKELMEPNAAAKCSCAETQIMVSILEATGFEAPKRDVLRILSVDAETNLAAPSPPRVPQLTCT